jgi:hypothetical protein
MSGLRPVTRVVFCVILACLLASCTPHVTLRVIPDRLATIEEAYSSPQAYQVTPEITPGSYKKAVFNAPYADVFRAVELSSTQVGQNIESSDRAKGLILATRENKRDNGLPRHFYYAITVKELGSKATEVVVFSKMQFKLWTNEHPASGTVEEASRLKWSGEGDGTLSQLMNFIRNNLYAAGAL